MERTKRLKKRQKSLIFPQKELILSLLLVIFGAALVTSSFSKNASYASVDQVQQENKNKPSKIYIPTLNKTLEITEGIVQNDRWTISESGVSYLTSSALPGQPGNSIIYGHNKKDILGDLEKVQINDAIHIIMENGNLFSYKVSETKEVKPSQVDILTQTSDERIAIYTCSGFLDQARFVVIAKATS